MTGRENREKASRVEDLTGASAREIAVWVCGGLYTGPPQHLPAANSPAEMRGATLYMWFGN